MSNSVLIGQYVEAQSIFHRLDPRTKIICILMLMLSFLMVESLASYLLASSIIYLILRCSHIPVRTFLSGLKPIVFILSFTFLYQIVLTDGTAIWSWSMIRITQEGILQGIHNVWRIMLLVLVASFLTLTTKPLTLAVGLEKLLAPLSKLNIPVEQISLMIVIAIRFIPTILEELQRILLAQKARGYDIQTLPFPKRLFAYIPLLIPLLFTTIQRAENLTNAIDARAYGQGKNRTHYFQCHFKKIDYQVFCSTILIAIALLVMKLGGI